MEPFASTDDYRALYDAECDDARLQALLGRASRDIAAELRGAGIGFAEPDEDFAEDLADVAIAMVHRALGEPQGDDAPEIPYGATQFSQGAGSYTASASLANPYGDLFMTKAERRKLGIGRARVGFASPF